MIKKNNKQGFTLLELLVSITLMLVLVILVVTIFQQSSTIFSISEAKMELFQNARVALDIMSRELASAQNDSANFRIRNPKNFTGTSDEKQLILSFDTFTNAQNTFGRFHVRYLVERFSAKRWSLVRQIFTDEGPTPGATPPSVAISEDIILQFVTEDTNDIPQLKFDAFQFNSTSSQWEKVSGLDNPDDVVVFDRSTANLQLPRTVRVTLSLKPRKRKEIVRTLSQNFWIAAASDQ